MTTIFENAAGILTNKHGQPYVAAMEFIDHTLPACTLVTCDPLFYCNVEVSHVV